MSDEERLQEIAERLEQAREVPLVPSVWRDVYRNDVAWLMDQVRKGVKA